MVNEVRLSDEMLAVYQRLEDAKRGFPWLRRLRFLWHARQDMEVLCRRIRFLEDAYKVLEQMRIEAIMEQRRLKIENVSIMNELRNFQSVPRKQKR